MEDLENQVLAEATPSPWTPRSLSPLTPEQTGLVDRLVPTLTPEQRVWLSGYLAGWDASARPTPQLDQPGAGVLEVTVVYGSQTGNAHGLAEEFADRIRHAGLSVKLLSLADFPPRELRQTEHLILITSTQGDGDPPDNAIAFKEFLESRKAPRLEQLRYAVLALGDSSYEYFCKTGRDFDQRLQGLGATPLHPRVDCDVDFVEAAQRWMDQLLETLCAEATANGTETVRVTVSRRTVSQAVAFSRSNPFRAEIVEHVELNGRGSDRSTRHLELSLSGSGLTWEPGDSLGIYPQNEPNLVRALVEAADWDPALVLDDGRTLGEALTSQYEITVLSRILLEKLVAVTEASALSDLLRPERQEELRRYIVGRDLVDLLHDLCLRGVPAREFVTALRRLPPRLYSIASSSAAFPEEVHLAVRLVDYCTDGRVRYGVCSRHLAERAVGESVPVFVQRNPNFRLPADPHAPIIMIGPGTGIAPFRAFVQERQALGADGASWLLFGDRHFRTDFLYQSEWLQAMRQGALTRMDVAFSRDSSRKIYVQHRLLEHAAEVYRWLERGAYVYVCGEEQNMAPDVERALTEIIMRNSGSDSDGAAAYLAEMRASRRYQRDVY